MPRSRTKAALTKKTVEPDAFFFGNAALARQRDTSKSRFLQNQFKRSLLLVPAADDSLAGCQPSASQPLPLSPRRLGLSASPPLSLYLGLEAKSSDNSGERLRVTNVASLQGTVEPRRNARSAHMDFKISSSASKSPKLQNCRVYNVGVMEIRRATGTVAAGV